MTNYCYRSELHRAAQQADILPQKHVWFWAFWEEQKICKLPEALPGQIFSRNGA